MTRSILFLAVTMTLVGCHTPPPAAAPLSTPTETAFVNDVTGVTLNYPSTWRSVADNAEGVVLHVAPTDDSIHLTVNVPKLPFHLGILPMGQIRSGYIDDFKRKVPDAAVTNVPITVPDANAARLLVTGPSVVDRAVLLTHNDHVIVITCDSPSKGPADELFEQVIRSIRFTK